MKLARKLLMLVIVLAALTGGGYLSYFRWYLPAQAAPTPALKTARVRTGDMAITASGVGALVPAAQVDLAFRSGGLLAELNVKVGERVKKGQVLARLEDSALQLQYAQAELNLKEIFSASAIIGAEEAVVAAEAALDKANKSLSFLISANVFTWEEKLAQGQADLEAAQAALAAGSGTQAAVDEAQKAVTWAERSLAQAQTDFLADNRFPPSTETVELARATVRTAELRLKEAQVYLAMLLEEEVSAEDLAYAGGTAYFKLEQARLSIQSARLALDNMQLIAPLDGIVTKVNATAGQTVGAAPIVSLATLDELMVRFYVEEADLGKVTPGAAVNLSFEAYPDLTLKGEVVRLEPVLATVDGNSVVVAWATLDETSEVMLISGMAVEVEVVAAEAKGALLAPAQALRELSPGSFAVFIVLPSGELKLTPVKVGLKDFASAEIIEGLKAGDVVSTGNIETK
jgi:HlyD family secretion protein